MNQPNCIRTFCERAAAVKPAPPTAHSGRVFLTLLMMLLTTATAWAWTGSGTSRFYYQMKRSGNATLTVNGQDADYTTSKFFIDEVAGETVSLDVVYSPEVSNPYAVEIYSNVGRRDFWDADIDGDGVADAIRPPSGDLVTADTEDSYFLAIPMEWDASTQAWKKTLTVDKTGAYRLTARYKATADGEWVYYSSAANSLRDHAVVISPKKVLEQRVYEVNGLTVKASAPSEAGHSTFTDLIEGEDGYAEFGIPYLNRIQANCLLFQPIHTSGGYGLTEDGKPGNPYATKDYFSVSKWYGKSGTTAGALSEFQSFVSACDAGKSPSMSTSSVGTVNVMLDAAFGHTSWDAVFGVMGETLGIVPAGTGASTAIANVKPGWYASDTDYGEPATYYNNSGPNEPGKDPNHDIAYAPDRGDIGKWEDAAELFYGRYSALVRRNPDDNDNYLNEDDQYDYTSMSEDTEKLWEYMGSYVPYWLEKTGHYFGNERLGQTDANGTAYDDYGIDGLRCAFAEGLPPQFWEYCINRARSMKWNFMFIAEAREGGKPAARCNRQFDVVDASFETAARTADSPSELLAAAETAQSACDGGAALLNLARYDEPMPFADPWMTASRYAMLSTLKGLQISFYGQEQGTIPCDWGNDYGSEGTIIQPGNAPFGFSKFELNSGKWVPDFKTWNQLTVWNNPPMGTEASYGMAQLYGHVNWARASSPALRSDVQYMLDRVEGYRSSDVWAMAKSEEYGALANGKDAVLAFVLFVNDIHYATSQTFSIPAKAAAMLGLEAGESYTARNLASGNPEQFLWIKTTEELTSEGVWVNFTADQGGNAFYDDGAMVQFLKLEKAPTYNITYVNAVDGEDGVTNDNADTYTYGRDLDLVDATKAGYTFGGWYSDESCTDEYRLTSIAAFESGDKELWAKWTENVLTLLNDDNSQDADHKNSKLISDAASASGKTFNVTLQDRTLYKDGEWNTICLPFNVVLEDSPLSGAIAKTLADATMTGTHVTLTFGNAVDELEAGVPYIIKWANNGDNDIVDPVFSGVTIVKSEAGTIEKADGNVKFIGYYDAFGITADDTDIYYMTAGSKLKYTGVPRTLKSCRAYFQFTEAAAARQFVLDFGDGDVTTGIVTLDNLNVSQSDDYYDLLGRKMPNGQMRKGLYINNGKKVVVK